MKVLMPKKVLYHNGGFQNVCLKFLETGFIEILEIDKLPKGRSHRRSVL